MRWTTPSMLVTVPVFSAKVAEGKTTWAREGGKWLLTNAEGYMNAQNAYEGYSL